MLVVLCVFMNCFYSVISCSFMAVLAFSFFARHMSRASARVQAPGPAAWPQDFKSPRNDAQATPGICTQAPSGSHHEGDRREEESERKERRGEKGGGGKRRLT